MGTITILVVTFLVLFVGLFWARKKFQSLEEDFKIIVDIAQIIGAIAGVAAFVIALLPIPDPGSVSNSEHLIETTQIAEAKQTILAQVTPTPYDICGEVIDLNFKRAETDQYTNSGNWEPTFVHSNPDCWYKITTSGLKDGLEVNQISGAGPFRALDAPSADFPCGESEFEVWAIMNGASLEQWKRISDTYIIAPEFCFSTESDNGTSPDDSLPSTATPMSNPIKAETQVTMGGIRKAYDMTLENGDILVGHADEFQSYIGCVVYLVIGPGHFVFEIKSGLWDRWLNVTPDLYDGLLKEQSDTLINKYNCTPIKIVKCDEYSCTAETP